MMELIARLPAGARVLDLGAAAGSFPATRRDIVVVRLDLEPRPGVRAGSYVAVWRTLRRCRSPMGRST